MCEVYVMSMLLSPCTQIAKFENQASLTLLVH
jgi:hypothetical protein